ncbi:hypothetical protein DZF99_09350, partial [Clavibacter phaseoli]
APPIIRSTLGTHAGVIGAALLAGGPAMSPGFAVRAEASLRASTAEAVGAPASIAADPPAPGSTVPSART